jgi:hypothetical protein
MRPSGFSGLKISARLDSRLAQAERYICRFNEDYIFYCQGIR